jgi:cellulose synthase/poly-beta-1,6-N-acetylglucosamine synthase-like glycosyltransferase
MNFFIFAILSVALVAISLPGTIELAFLTIGGVLPSRKPGARVRNIRRLAVVIPAHNEAGTVGKCLASLSKCLRPNGVEARVVVVADNCSDATAEVARRAGAEVLVRIDSSGLGKNFALQYAFEHALEAGFDAVLVIDADTTAEPNLLIEIVNWLDAGADGVQCRYLVANTTESVRTRLMSIALMAFNVVRPRGRARWGLSAGILGNGFALRNSTLRAVPYRAESIVEDLEYHLELVRGGRRMVLADATCVRAEMPARSGSAASQRARWEGGRFGFAARTVPSLIGGLVRGDLRLVEPLLDLLLLPLGLHVLMLASLLAIPYWPGRFVAAASLAVVAFHVIAGIILGGGGVDELSALAAAPWYIVWKLTVLPQILRSARRHSEWVRTQRAGES